MKELNYGKDYGYSHSGEGNFINQEFFPEEIKGTQLYTPGNNNRENSIKDWLMNLWKGKY
jgi:putative ATPase